MCSAPAPAKLSLQAYPALKILYVWHRTITETPMVHCTLDGLICRHKHVKDLLVQHFGELLGFLDLRASKQVKSKRTDGWKRSFQWRKLLRSQQDCICWTLSHSGIQAKDGHPFSLYSSACSGNRSPQTCFPGSKHSAPICFSEEPSRAMIQVTRNCACL
jgi:hypothetical protein